MLDHTTARAAAVGLGNVSATTSDARVTPFADGSFDGAYAGA